MAKENCWEVMSCERQEGGAKVHEFGVCPASLSEKFAAVNQGDAAGRYCWMVEGTLCENRIQGNWATKMKHCLTECSFFKKVHEEEGSEFKI